MSSRQSVEIIIKAQDLSQPAIKSLVDGLRDVGGQATATSQKLETAGTTAQRTGQGMTGLGNSARTVGQEFAEGLSPVPGLFSSASVAAGGLGVAVGAFAVSSVKAFASFQQGMQEAFSLIPNASADMKEKLTADVMAVSREYAILPEQVIPALYQALSAGVPPENVMTFLKQSAETSIAGVTDLKTATDVLSTAVNAYGQSASQAGHDSDILFTAVRLGKTTMGELGQNLSNVVPIAASVKIGLDQVAAAIATMTVQGESTNVATTNLRQMLTELSAAGSQVGKVFEQVAGQSFGQFIASGHNLGDALNLLNDYAQKNGVSIRDLFTSVEAGRAALELTGTHAQTFATDLDAMGKSAGATQTAFNEMNTGAAKDLRELQTALAELQISAGKLAAPAVKDLADNFVTVADDAEIAMRSVERFNDALGSIPGVPAPLKALHEIFTPVGPPGAAVGLGILDDLLGKVGIDASGMARSFGESLGIMDKKTEETTSIFDAFAQKIHDAGMRSQGEGLFPIQDANDFSTALNRLTKDGQYYLGIQNDISAGYARQAEYAGAAEERTAAYAQSIQLGSGSAAELAYNLAHLHGALDDVSGAYQIGLKIQADYGNQASEYSGQIDTIQKGLEVWKRRLDDGSISQDEYNRKVSEANQAIARYSGGVDDATTTAADYAIENAKLMQIQDQINSQYPNLVHGSAEYNQKLAEAASQAGISQGAIDNFKGSNATLTDTIANSLIPALEHLIERIGELDGKHATVTLETKFITTGDSSMFGYFTGGGTVGITEGDNTGPAGTWTGPTTPTPQSRDHAAQRAVLPGGGPGGRPIVPPGAVEAAQADYRDAASYVDLVKQTIALLQEAAKELDSDGTQAVKDYADTAKSALDVMTGAVDFVKAMGDQVILYGDWQARDIANLKFIAEKSVSSLGDSAALFSSDYLDHTKTYADAAKSALDVISSAVDVVKAMGDTVFLYGEWQEKNIAALKFIAEKATVSVGDSAAIMGGPFLAGIKDYADAANAALGVIGNTVDLMVKIRDAGDLALKDQNQIDRLFAELAIVSMQAAYAIHTVAATWDAGQDGSINQGLKDFADASSASLSLLGNTIDLLTKLRDGTITNADFARDFALQFQQMSQVAKMAADAVHRVAVDDWMAVNDNLKAFTESAGASLSLLGNTLDFLQKLSDSADLTLPPVRSLSATISHLRTDAVMVARAIRAVSGGWDDDVTAPIKSFGESVQASTGALSDTLGFLQDLAGVSDRSLPSASQVRASATALAREALLIAEAFKDAAGSWESQTDPNIKTFADDASASLSTMSDAVSALTDLVKFSDLKPIDVKQLSRTIVEDVDIIAQAVEQAKSLWEQRGMPDLKDFAASAGAAVDLVGKMAGSFESIAEMGKITAKQAGIFEDNFRTVIQIIHDLADEAEAAEADAQRFNAAAQMIADGMDAASRAINDVGGSTSSAAAGLAHHGYGSSSGPYSTGGIPGTPPTGQGPTPAQPVRLHPDTVRELGREFSRALGGAV